MTSTIGSPKCVGFIAVAVLSIAKHSGRTITKKNQTAISKHFTAAKTNCDVCATANKVVLMARLGAIADNAIIQDAHARTYIISRAAHPGNQYANYSCKYAVRHRSS